MRDKSARGVVVHRIALIQVCQTSDLVAIVVAHHMPPALADLSKTVISMPAALR